MLEDAIQELFIELWQAKSRTSVLSVQAYLFKALKYKILKLSRRKRDLLPLKDNEGSFEWSHETFLIAEQDDAEKHQMVLRAVSQLTSRQKEIVYLKYYQGLSYEEVSEIMGINYQAARNLLYQAIKSLKNWLPGSLQLILFLSFLSRHYI